MLFRSIIFGVVLIMAVILVFANYKSTTFWEAKITDIITIVLGAVITFFITERMTDKRRRNDCIEHIIMEIEAFVSDAENFKINKNTLLKQASCANRIKYLKDASFSDIEDDVAFIEQHFSEIRNLYSNHNSSDESLNEVRIDIDRHIDQIVDKCSKIRIGLYT